jgi:signal transduction histidine kinase
MRQLLQNLISNALKFHRPDQPPVIRIHSESARPTEPDIAGECRVIVEDNGIGFEEQYKERVSSTTAWPEPETASTLCARWSATATRCQ